jgi:type 1 glutamine amidotransferase
MPHLALSIAFMIVLLCGSVATAHEPLKVAVTFGEGKQQLLDFKKYLEANYRVECRVVEATNHKEKKETPFAGLEGLRECDVILSNLYRSSAPPDQLEKLKQAFRTKPVVGLRKAHHGFQNWLEADQEVFGVSYKGHYFGKNVAIRFAPGKENDPLVIGLKPFLPGGGLYQNTNPADDVKVLMEGGPEDKPAMPQVWVRERKAADGLRAMYTRYDPRDLSKDTGVRDMVTRGLFWAARRDEKEMQRK